jgi:hypothetical protein
MITPAARAPQAEQIPQGLDELVAVPVSLLRPARAPPLLCPAPPWRPRTRKIDC